MIAIPKLDKTIFYSGSINEIDNIKGDIPNNSIYYCMDTNETYMYSKNESQWVLSIKIKNMEE